MRVSIPKGFHPSVQKLMAQLQTDDPALAVNHIIGSWIASNGSLGVSTPSEHNQEPQKATENDFDEYANILEF